VRIFLNSVKAFLKKPQVTSRFMKIISVTKIESIVILFIVIKIALSV